MNSTEIHLKYLDAAKAGDPQTVRAMLDAGVGVDFGDDRKVPRNRTALMHAAESGHLEIVELLLSAGAKLEAKDKGVGFDWPGGNTALILAIKNKQIQVANRLLDAGANPTAKSVDTTALRAAVEAGDFELIRRLVELGADPAQAPTDGISAMLNAIYENNARAVELFLEKGADPNAKTPGGNCLLSAAVSQDNLEICKVLCSHGAFINVRDDDYHFTPLMVACVSSQAEEMFRFLLSVGAVVNAINIRNETVMDLIEQAYQRYSNASPADSYRVAKKGKDVRAILKSLEKIKSMLREAGAMYFKELPSERNQKKEDSKDKKSTIQPGHMGISHFLRSMYDGQPEWSLFAIKSPVDAVSSAFARLHKAKRRMSNVRLRPAGKYDDVETMVAAVQPKSNPWTVVFRSISWVDLASIKAVFRDAKELSSQLSTRSVTFIGEDTSGAMAYEIFDGGKSLEKAEWLDVGFTTFKSILRKEPETEMVDDKFLDDTFRAEGIYVPCCYPMSEKGESWLAVEEVSKGAIQRADLIELPNG